MRSQPPKPAALRATDAAPRPGRQVQGNDTDEGQFNGRSGPDDCASPHLHCSVDTG